MAMRIADVLPLLREVTGSGVEVDQAVLLKKSQDYRVWAVDTRAPRMRLIIKLGGQKAQYSCAFERAAAIHRLVREQAGLPAPEVLAADESCQKWPWRYFIKTYLPGQEWAEVAKQVQPGALDGARAELGTLVARLHQIIFNGFGEITAAGVVADPMDCFDALAWHARQIITDPAAQAFFLEALAARRALFDGVQVPSLCHEDLHQYNILLHETRQGWQIAAILDFEKAWSGHRESDLARMDLWRMTGAPFWQSYGQVFPVEPGYAERRPLYQLLWCLEFAEQSEKHLADTRQVCRELGIPEVARFRPAFR